MTYQNDYHPDSKGCVFVIDITSTICIIRVMKRSLQEVRKSRMTYIVGKALRKGVIESKPCEICGIVGKETMQNGKERSIIQAHHDDYNKPLTVRWLCRKHHSEWHDLNQPVRLKQEMIDMMPAELYALGIKELEAHDVQRVA